MDKLYALWISVNLYVIYSFRISDFDVKESWHAAVYSTVDRTVKPV